MDKYLQKFANIEAALSLSAISVILTNLISTSARILNNLDFLGGIWGQTILLGILVPLFSMVLWLIGDAFVRSPRIDLINIMSEINLINEENHLLEFERELKAASNPVINTIIDNYSNLSNTEQDIMLRVLLNQKKASRP